MNPVKVMLVDDEVLAIEHLRQLISWESIGCEIVCAASKPSQVVRLAREHRPELVLMDIVMPGTDGLTLSKELLADDPALKIVLLTSYKEFEYAKEAVRMGVANYWVKHEMDADTFRRELGGLREEIVNERRARRNDRGRWLVDWLGGRPLTDAQWKTATAGLGDGFDRLHLLVLKPDRPFPVVPGAAAGAPELPAEWPEEGDPDLLAAVRFLDDAFVLVYGDNGSRREGKMRELLEEKAAAAARTLERVAGGGVSLAAAYGLAGRAEVPGKLAEALRWLALSVFYGPRHLFRLNDLRPEDAGFAPLAWEDGAERARESLLGQRFEEAAGELSALFAQAAAAKDAAGLGDLCRYLVAALNRGRQACGLPPLAASPPPSAAQAPSAAAAASPSSAALSAAAAGSGASAPCDWLSLSGIRSWFLAEVSALADAASGASPVSRKVRQALEFMQANYADPDIDTDAIARYLGISRDHLRHVFKEETGRTVLDRLTDIRMERAKQLLDEGKHKIYEIAEKVGFRNGQYFSQVFRKSEGLTPLEYMDKRR